MIATAIGRRKRTCSAKKQATGKVGTVLPRASADQGDSLGHGSPEKELPEAPGTFSTGTNFGELKSKREKVDREVERCCQCTRHSTCHCTCEFKERGSTCMNCMCFLQCFNKVDRKPSLATAGSRATLHRFFSTPEKTQEPKPALEAIEDENNGSIQKEDKRGDVITIAPHHEADEEDIVENYPEDSGAVAKAACIETTADKQQKTERTRRNSKRTLR